MLSLSLVRVPYAIDRATGRPVLPIEVPGPAPAFGRYACPACDANLKFRRGAKRVPHFSHHVSSSCAYHGHGESDEHRRACDEIKAAILRWNRGYGPRPDVVVPCPRHREGHRFEVPVGIVDILVDRRISNGCRPDITLLGTAREVLLLIEIYRSHSVPESKEYALGSLPWVEIEVGEVKPGSCRWRASRYGGLDLKPSCTAVSCEASGPSDHQKAAHGISDSSFRGTHLATVVKPSAFSNARSADVQVLPLFCGWGGLLPYERDTAGRTCCETCRAKGASGCLLNLNRS